MCTSGLPNMSTADQGLIETVIKVLTIAKGTIALDYRPRDPLFNDTLIKRTGIAKW